MLRSEHERFALLVVMEEDVDLTPRDRGAAVVCAGVLSWGLGVALLVHVVASLRARQLRSSGENGVQVVDAIVDQLLCCVIAALSGARDSDEAMTRAPLQGTPCCEPPGPFTSGIPPGKGSFLSMCGWPAVSFTPSRCARAHATVLLRGQAGGNVCR